MKRLSFLTAMVAVLFAATMQAQTYERKDFTYKTTKEINSDGVVKSLNIETYAGGKLVQTFFFEPELELSEEEFDENVKITEPDINFDGYPDVDIYLGYLGGFSNNTQHEGLLWDQMKHCFVQPEGYSGIGEPQFDATWKVITTTLSAGPDERVTTYYRWHGHVLQDYLTETWALDSDDFSDFSGVLNLPCYCFAAKLDGRISVDFAFQRTDDGIVAGYIYYPRAKHPAPIMIAGTCTEKDGTTYYSLDEFQPDGTITGHITLDMQMADRWDYDAHGTWTNPTTHKVMQMTDLRFDREARKWFTESLLTPKHLSRLGQSFSIRGIKVGSL